MFETLGLRVLRLLRVPPEPEPPFGAPGSVRVFRAGRNFFRLRLWLWGYKQVIAFAAILFWALLFLQIEQEVKTRRQTRARAVTPASAQDFNDYLRKVGAADRPTTPAVGSDSPEPANPDAARHTASPDAKPNRGPSGEGAKIRRPRDQMHGWAGFKRLLVEVARLLPSWSFPLLWALKLAGFTVYLAQLPFTYALMRLDYEQRWYVVTDRSLRLRTGVWRVRELTMSFANLQQITVTQGPLQRLLGLADVCVRSAGGGGAMAGHQGAALQSLHTGYFHAVDNAEAIRDLITERLRRFRESGLGDPDEKRHAAPSAGPKPTAGDASVAAQELLAETRALRAALL